MRPSREGGTAAFQTTQKPISLTNKTNMKLKKLFLALVSIALLTSCDLMKEDEDTTTCGLFVTFKYDYNLQRADMFRDHVGSITLYVFDSDGRFVRTYESNNIPAMGRMLNGEYVHCMQIMDLPNGKYRFIALANQKSYEATLATPGPKYRRAAMAKGDANERLTVRLDRETVSGATSMVSNVAPMDTLWHGMTGAEPVRVVNNGQTITQISMVRDTKMLTISLHNLDEDKRADMDTEDFEYFIIDNNGYLGYNNSLLSDEDIVYTPFHKWNTYVADNSGVTTEATAHAGITFNRLIWDAQPDKNATLIIRNKTNNKEVAAINLTDALAQGRNAYDAYAYSRQEYLDRSYDYYMDFFIKNDVWQYADVRINVLSWAHRIQNVSLQ